MTALDKLYVVALFFLFLVFYQLNPVACITMTDNKSAGWKVKRDGKSSAARRTYCLRTGIDLLLRLSPAFLQKTIEEQQEPMTLQFSHSVLSCKVERRIE